MELNRVSNYKLIRILGRGGMGSVYEALQISLNRNIALKLILPEAVKNEDTRRRFLREARLMGRLSHPNVVHLYDYGCEEDKLFIVMELMSGKPLSVYLKESGPLTPNKVIRLGDEMAQGVGALHEVGIVHRDIKDSNLFLDVSGTLKVMDLGLATGPDVTQLTVEGQVSGTLAFMAPEIAYSGFNEKTYDVFQMGMVLHIMATGKHPFPNPPLSYVMKRQPLPDPVIAAPGTCSNQRLVGVVKKCLELDPVDRYPDASALHLALSALSGRESLAIDRKDFALIGGSEGSELELDRQPSQPTMVAPGRLPGGSPSSRDSDGSIGGMGSGPSRALGLDSVTSNRSGLVIGSILVVVIAAAFAVFRPSRDAKLASGVTQTVSSPPSRAALPPDWFNLSGTMYLDDDLYNETKARRRDSFRSDGRIVVFELEMNQILSESEHVTTLDNFLNSVEYFPEESLTPSDATQVQLVPVASSRPPIMVRAEPSGDVRRIVLGLRPEVEYILKIRGDSIRIQGPPLRFSRGLHGYGGRDTVLFTHYSLGYPCRIAAYRRHDGSPMEPSQPPRKSLPYCHYLKFRAIQELGLLTILVHPADPDSRLILARYDWQPETREGFENGLKVWLTNVSSLGSGATLGASMRKWSGLIDEEKQSNHGLRDLALDGKDFNVPQTILKWESLLDDGDPEVRRGAVSGLGLLDGDEKTREIHEFMEKNTEPEDWIHGLEALWRAGEENVRDRLIQRLESGKVGLTLNWTATYARAIPDTMRAILSRPDESRGRFAPDSLALLDRVAAYLIGPATEPWLLRIPADRAFGNPRLSIPFALRLLDSPASLARLQELAESQKTAVGSGHQ